jgi:hypothetical protein
MGFKMCKFFGFAAAIAAVLTLSSPMGAQQTGPRSDPRYVHGTPGFSPGAWPLTELPDAQELRAKPFDPHDLTSTGVWQITRGPYSYYGVTYSQSLPPFTSEGKAKLAAAKPSYGSRAVLPSLSNDPISKCDPLGYPRVTFTLGFESEFEFIQASDGRRVLMHTQYHDNWRTIWTDGRPLPQNPPPAWNGYSVGKWEGDTFVIESTGYDDRTWLDHFGNPHSDQMHIEERWHRADPDTLELSLTITDPKIYAKPWVSDKKVFKLSKEEMYEELCVPSEEENFNEKIRDVAVSKANP